MSCGTSLAGRGRAECRLILKDTLQFPLAEVDPDGILILDLRTAVANPTSVAWVKKREAARSKNRIFAEEGLNLSIDRKVGSGS